MPQIYRRTRMPKCDFNKVAKQTEKEEIIEFEMDCVASMLRAKSSNGTG